MKKTAWVVLCLFAVIVLIILFTIPKDRDIVKPHIFYSDSVYSQETPVKEYKLAGLRDGLTEAGVIDTLIDDTAVCNKDYQANRPHLIGATIYRLKDGSLDAIYIQFSTSADTLVLFNKEE